MTTVGLVCSGNICRSYMAEKVYRAHIPDVDWISAGTDPHGPAVGPDVQAVDALRRHGYTDVEHRARGISNRLLSCDFLLVMEDYHRRKLLALGCTTRQVRMLTEFDPAAPYEQVVNPWGLPDLIYDRVMGLIDRCEPGVRRLVTG